MKKKKERKKLKNTIVSGMNSARILSLVLLKMLPIETS